MARGLLCAGLLLSACHAALLAQPAPTTGPDAPASELPDASTRAAAALGVARAASGAAATLLPGVDDRTWIREAKLEAVVTATSNGAGRPKGLEEADVLIALAPGLRVRRRGADFSLDLDGALDLTYSTNGTRRNRAFPVLRADAKATLVERFLFLDASADVRQTEIDPYSGRGDAGSTDNLRTSAIYRISPRVEYQFSPRVGLLARIDDAVTKYSGNAAANLETREALVRLEGRPEPLGFGLELTRVDTVYDASDLGDWTLDSARAHADFAFDGQFIVGAIGGVDRSNFALSSHTDSIAGARFRWSPSPRTQFDATVERRFFGNSWNGGFRHRMPWLAVSVRTQREPITSTGSLGAAAEGQNLGEFLDAILTTRFPDPIQRAALVESLITSRGLESTLANAIGVLADYAQLRTGGDVTLVLLSPRDVLSLSFYVQVLRQLTRTDGADILQGTSFAADSRQSGTRLEYNHRLTPVSSLSFAARWSRISGLGTRKNDSTNDASYRLAWSLALSPRSDFSLGAQYRRVKTVTAAGTSFTDVAVFTGLAHRF